MCTEEVPEDVTTGGSKTENDNIFTGPVLYGAVACMHGCCLHACEWGHAVAVQCVADSVSVRAGVAGAGGLLVLLVLYVVVFRRSSKPKQQRRSVSLL